MRRTSPGFLGCVLLAPLQARWRHRPAGASSLVAEGHRDVLTGVGGLARAISGLDDTGQVHGLLFDSEEREKQSRVDARADEIKERFGARALRRGSSLRGERPTAL